MFWAAAARKNCSRTNFILRKRRRRSPIWFLSSANSASTFLSLPLRLGEVGRLGQVSSALPSRFMHVDGKILKLPWCIALSGARPTALAGSDIGMGAVPSIGPP